MLREIITGLVVVFMASSVIISNILRSTRSDKPQLPAKNVNRDANIPGERDNPPAPSPALEPESKEPNSRPKEV
jgi:hypothetical protein